MRKPSYKFFFGKLSEQIQKHSIHWMVLVEKQQRPMENNMKTEKKEERKITMKTNKIAIKIEIRPVTVSLKCASVAHIRNKQRKKSRTEGNRLIHNERITANSAYFFLFVKAHPTIYLFVVSVIECIVMHNSIAFYLCDAAVAAANVFVVLCLTSRYNGARNLNRSSTQPMHCKKKGDSGQGKQREIERIDPLHGYARRRRRQVRSGAARKHKMQQAQTYKAKMKMIRQCSTSIYFLKTKQNKNKKISMVLSLRPGYIHTQRYVCIVNTHKKV